MLILDQALFESLTSPTDFARFIFALKTYQIEFKIIHTHTSVLHPQTTSPPFQTPRNNHHIFTSKSGIHFQWHTDARMPPHLSIETQNAEILYTQALDMGIKILRANGFAQYHIAQNQGEQQLLLIPAANQETDIIDMNDKVIRTSFIFWRQRSVQPYIAPTQHDPRKNPSRLQFKADTLWGNKLTLIENMTYLLSQWLQENHITADETLQNSFSKEKFSSFAFIQPSLRSASTCNFCTPKTIYNQLVLDAGSWLILLNYRPTVGTRAHFLVLPKYHIDDWYELQTPQINALHKIIQAISRSIQARCQLAARDVIAYVQNGNQVGQTTPHTHMHVLNTPAFAPYLIDIYGQMCAQKAPILSREEMRALANLLGPIIYQELCLTMGPLLAIAPKLTTHLQTLQLTNPDQTLPLSTQAQQDIEKHCILNRIVLKL